MLIYTQNCHNSDPFLLLSSNEIDMWSIGCLFAEMKAVPRAPLLPGKDDINQLELIYQLLGRATSVVLCAWLFTWLLWLAWVCCVNIPHILVIYSLIYVYPYSHIHTGTPTGDLEAQYKTLPNYDKMFITRVYTGSKLTTRFGRIFDTNTIQLLSRFLEMDPKRRISAAAALDTE